MMLFQKKLMSLLSPSVAFAQIDLCVASRAEQSRAEQSRAEQSRAEQSRAEQSRAGQTVLVCHSDALSLRISGR